MGVDIKTERISGEFQPRVCPRRQWVPILVHQQHLGILAQFTEIVGGIDREKHRFPFGIIRPVFVPIELDEPNVVLTNDYVARVRMTRNHRGRQRILMKPGSRHDVSPMFAYEAETTPPASICSRRATPFGKYPEPAAILRWIAAVRRSGCVLRSC
jgi:hypothetical protein